MPKFKVSYRITKYQRVSDKQVTDVIEANDIHEARLKAHNDLPLDVHTADIVKMVTELRVTEVTSKDKEGESSTNTTQNDELRPCCIEAFGRETHYHCANCGEESGMYGHYIPIENRFRCESKNGKED